MVRVRKEQAISHQQQGQERPLLHPSGQQLQTPTTPQQQQQSPRQQQHVQQYQPHQRSSQQQSPTQAEQQIWHQHPTPINMCPQE